LISLSFVSVLAIPKNLRAFGIALSMLNMSFEFPCPWCGCDTKVRGSEAASWRFRIPCDLCSRDMIVTWDGGLIVGRAAQPLKRTDEETVRIRLAKAG